MADLGFGGRVLAGEDSEEDEEEEELDFQFNGGSNSRRVTPILAQAVVQPRFSVQSASAGNEDDESEDDEAGEHDPTGVRKGVEEAEGEVLAADHDDLGGRLSVASSSVRSISRPTTPELPTPHEVESSSSCKWGEENSALWVIDPSVDGAQMMGHAIIEKLQPTLDSSIRRIAELTECQQRLLALLASQHKRICSNVEIENVAIVMGKLPQYIKKVQDIKAAMESITSSVDRMNKRSEILRVDAQSHAIKKENKRESLSQWNKLYVAAKSYEGVAMSTTMSSTSLS